MFSYLENTHGVDNAFLDSIRASYREDRKEMLSHSNQSILGPLTEPVHGTAREQTRELQRAVAELFTNLTLRREKKDD